MTWLAWLLLAAAVAQLPLSYLGLVVVRLLAGKGGTEFGHVIGGFAVSLAKLPRERRAAVLDQLKSLGKADQAARRNAT